MSEHDYASRHRAARDESATEYEAPGRKAWASSEPRWGIWRVPESQLHWPCEEIWKARKAAS